MKKACTYWIIFFFNQKFTLYKFRMFETLLCKACRLFYILKEVKIPGNNPSEAILFFSFDSAGSWHDNIRCLWLHSEEECSLCLFAHRAEQGWKSGASGAAGQSMYSNSAEGTPSQGRVDEAQGRRTDMAPASKGLKDKCETIQHDIIKIES